MARTMWTKCRKKSVRKNPQTKGREDSTHRAEPEITDLDPQIPDSEPQIQDLDPQIPDTAAQIESEPEMENHSQPERTSNEDNVEERGNGDDVNAGLGRHETGSYDFGMEEDDCPAINEDASGYREVEPELNETNDDEFVNVEICSEGEMQSQFGDVGEDGDDAGEEADDIGDDIWNDKAIPDPLSDDDDEAEAESRPFTCRSDGILALGKCFNNADEFKYALLRYSLTTEYDIQMYKSSGDRLGAKCSQHVKEECPWRIYCSFEKSRNKLMVKVYEDKHVCSRIGYTKLLKSGTIAQLYEERLRRNPKITADEMVSEIKREHNMIVSDHQCRRAKWLLSRKRKASHQEHFDRLWDYQEEVRRTNLGTTIEIETIPGLVPGSKPRFHRFYVCFAALREAWKQSCRPIIGLDAAFMKWDIKGQMLGAVGRDGDNRIFSIAWGVVEVEDNPNWLWFVHLLKKDLGLQDGDNITIISDKHKGILNAVNEELPKAEDRMCSRHILENWKKNHKDIELERMFWKIARSYTPESFASNMEVIKAYNLGAYEALQRTGPTTWSWAFFKLGFCCNHNLNNLCESFNRNVRESRKPLPDFLTEVRRKVMERNASRTVLTNRWKKRFTPRADREIESNRQKARQCIRYRTTGNVHEIDYHANAWSVDMDAKTCGCGYWQLNGIPCMHAMAVITNKGLNLNDYVADYYLTTKWRVLYAEGMKPVQGMEAWRRLGRVGMYPPPARTNRGRPHGRARFKGPQESSSNANKLTRHGRIPTCSNCRREGHNRTRCSYPKAPPPPRRPRGRPRKEGESSHASQGGGPSQASQLSQASQPSQAQGRFGFFT